LILIGQYDSPFVRRTAIALTLYGMPFEQKPWSVFGDAGKVAQYNPLIRVPTLVLDSGEVLIESAMILDYLDEEAGAAKRMMAPAGPARRQAQKVCALAAGLGEQVVAGVLDAVGEQESVAAVKSLSAHMQPLVVQALLTAFQRSLKDELREWLKES